MTTSGLHALIDRLPPELQGQVYDFATFLLERRAAPAVGLREEINGPERVRVELHRDIVTYAAAAAGTDSDLDENLEAAALEALDDAV